MATTTVIDLNEPRPLGGVRAAAAAADDPNSEATSSSTFLQLLDLPGEAVRQILACLPFRERLAVAGTCRSFLWDVESLSRAQLDSIVFVQGPQSSSSSGGRTSRSSRTTSSGDEQNAAAAASLPPDTTTNPTTTTTTTAPRRRVDGTFDQRIRDQTHLDTSATRRAKPVHLPWRYLLYAALRNCLYKIQIDNAKHCQFVLSPSEDLLAVAKRQGEGWIIQIWDLGLKEPVATLNHPPYQGRPLDGRLTFFFLSEHRIVSDSGHVFHVFTKNAASGSHEWILTGSLDLYFLRDRYIALNWFPANEHEILIVWMQDDDEPPSALFYTLRVSTDGSITWSETPSMVEEEDNFFVLAIAGISGKWMACHATRDDDGKQGVLVYNLETQTRVQTCWWAASEKIASLRQSSCCPRAFCSALYDDSQRFLGSRLFRLDDRTGQLSWGPLLRVGIPSRFIVDATESHVFHASQSPHRHALLDSVSAYNGDTGERERVLPIPMPPATRAPHLTGRPTISGTTAAKRNELFLATTAEELEVFCLKEPLV